MKSLIQAAIVFLLFGLAVLPARADFKALYVFGDGLSTTTDNPSVGSNYYGQRYSNGRVWVEVLSQRQGLTYSASKNNSYWDHNSAQTVTDVKNFTAPSDATNDLFIVWVCNADTYDAAVAQPALSFAQWQATNSLSQTNHLQIITNLYAKGVRTLILPNAVDISEIPAFNAGSLAPGMHAGCVDYNMKFSNTVSKARALCPNLKIYALDFSVLLNKVLTNAASYGLTNVLAGGYSIDALDAYNYGHPHSATNGYGTNYIFWDLQDPTAKFHEVMADVVQQSISPVQISRITALTGSNRLDVVNGPAGLNGFVDGCTNLTLPNWAVIQNINNTTTNFSVYVPTPPPITNSLQMVPAYQGLPEPGGTPIVIALEFYRLRFPYAWSWP